MTDAREPSLAGIPAACSAKTCGDINDSTTTTSCTKSSTEPTVAAPASASASPAASVKPAGINVLLPSGNTTRNSTPPCRHILPNTCKDNPTSGCRGLTTVTDKGKSSIPVVSRGFLPSRRFRMRG